MKNGYMKKTLALMLTLCMLLGALPTTALSDALQESQPTVAAETTAAPTADPDQTAEPTADPTAEPTAEATQETEPTAEPTVEATQETEPTAEPTVEATQEAEPTAEHTVEATQKVESTAEPTVEPTPDATQTVEPTVEPIVTLGLEETLYQVSIDSANAQLITLASDSNSFQAGDTVTLNVHRDALENGQILTRIAVNRCDNQNAIETSGQNTITFEMPEADVEVEAYLAEGYYVTLSIAGANDACYLVPPFYNDYFGNMYEQAGSTVSLQPVFSSSAGYRCSITVQAENNAATDVQKDALGIYSFTMPAGNVDISVRFYKVYTVRIDSIATDFLSLSTEQTEFEAGAEVTVLVNEDAIPAGSVLQDVTVNTDASSSRFLADITVDSHSFTMPEYNVFITGFLDYGYTITLNKIGEVQGCSLVFRNYSESLYDGRIYASVGTPITLIPICTDGYVCDLDVRDAENNPVTMVADDMDNYFVMPESEVTITATFKQQITFTVKTQGSTGSSYTEDQGYTFKDWCSENSPILLGKRAWRVQHADGTTQVIDDDNTTPICDGDVITQLYTYRMSSLTIYADCDVSELNSHTNCSNWSIEDGSLTVHHSVDGVEKDFVLTSTKNKLSDFADEDVQWYENNGTTAVTMDSKMPLVHTDYTTEQYYAITAEDVEKGSVTADKAYAPAGQKVTLTIAPDKNYELETCTVTMSSSGETVDLIDGENAFIMPSDAVKIICTFKRVEISFTVADTVHTVDEEDVSFFTWTATYYDGVTCSWSLTRGGQPVTVDADTVIQKGDVYQLNWMLTDAKILIIYASLDASELPEHTSYLISPGGSVTVQHYINDVLTEITLTSDCCMFGQMSDYNGYDWYDGTGEDANLVNNEVIPLNETKHYCRPFGITLENSAGGYAFGLSRALMGTEQTITICAENDYRFISLTKDGMDVTQDAVWSEEDNCYRYSFTMPAADVEIKAVFEAEHNLFVECSAGGSVTVSAEISGAAASKAMEGEAIRLTVQPDEGYALKSLKVEAHTGDGELDLNEMSFTMPAYDVCVKAEFVKIVSFKVIKGNEAFSKTAQEGEKFLACAALEGWELDAENRWRVKRGSGAVETVDAETAIAEDDEYELVWSMYDGLLTIYAACVRSELPQDYSAYEFAAAGSLTVEHTFNGETIPVNLNATCYYLSDVLNCYLGGDVAYGLMGVTGRTWFENGSQVDMDEDKVALEPANYVSYFYLHLYPAVNGELSIAYGSGADRKLYSSSVYALAGAVFEVVSEPNDGYEVEQYELYAYDGSDVKLSEDCFTMPASDMYLKVEFELLEPSYILTIPASVDLDGTSDVTVTISDVKYLPEDRQIEIAVESASGVQDQLGTGNGRLMQGENHIDYSFQAYLDFKQAGSQNLGLSMDEDSLASSPAGEYSDTLNFTVYIAEIAEAE